MKILIVEDDELLLEGLATLLEQSDDVDVLCAQNGTAGLDLARQHHPAAIVSNVHMPGLDGISLLAEIRGDPTTKHIPVLIMTSDTRVVSDFQDRGVEPDAFVIKPFTADRFVETMQRLIREHRGVNGI